MINVKNRGKIRFARYLIKKKKSYLFLQSFKIFKVNLEPTCFTKITRRHI